MIPLYSAAAVHEGIDLRAPLERVLTSHWFVLGPEVLAFEAEFASYIGVPHCVGVANGTEALEIALRALGVRSGDSVLCAPNAGFYGSAAALALGAQPRFVDVDERTLTLCPRSLAAALRGSRPAAVIATHLYGQLADIEAISALCREAGVPLIEDCAQAHGAQRAGRRAGSFGDAACFSFYPTKNLGALGDGGAILTQRADVAQAVAALRQYGWSSKYHVSLPGGRNSRLDELQAAVLRAKLPHLERQNAERRALASAYNEAFAALPVQCPVSLGEDFVAHLYVLRTREREALRAHLRAEGVASDVHYPVPDHRQAVLADGAPTSLPVTEAACESVLSLPCHPGLPEAAARQVIAAVRGFFTGR